MTVMQSIEYRHHSDLLEALEDSAMAIEALGVLLEMTMRSGEDMNTSSDGVFLLIKYQCDHLKNLSKAVGSEFNELSASKLEIRNLDKLAEMASVTPDVAKRVVEIATGIKPFGGTAWPTHAPIKPVPQFNETFGYSVAPENKEQTQ